MAASKKGRAAALKNGRMVVLLPDGVRLQITRHGDRCDFVYEESFRSRTKKMRQAIDASVEMVCRVGDPRVRVKLVNRGWTIRLTGKNVERELVGDMMSGEFMGWSSGADMTLRELIGLAVAAKAARINHHRAPGPRAGRARGRKVKVTAKRSRKRTGVIDATFED